MERPQGAPGSPRTAAQLWAGPSVATGVDPSLWCSWIGLPHAIGADPRDGKGACCMVVAHIILSELGLHPPDIKDWVELATKSQWMELQILFDRHFAPVFEPAVGSVALIRNGPVGLGVATYLGAGNGILIVHHSKGVVTMPLRLARLLQFAKLR